MSKAGPVVVADGREEDLSFTFKPAEGIAVYDAVAVALKFRSVGTLFVVSYALDHLFVDACAGVAAEYAEFGYLVLFSDGHEITPLIL